MARARARSTGKARGRGHDWLESSDHGFLLRTSSTGGIPTAAGGALSTSRELSSSASRARSTFLSVGADVSGDLASHRTRQYDKPRRVLYGSTTALGRRR